MQGDRAALQGGGKVWSRGGELGQLAPGQGGYSMKDSRGANRWSILCVVSGLFRKEYTFFFWKGQTLLRSWALSGTPCAFCHPCCLLNIDPFLCLGNVKPCAWFPRAPGPWLVRLAFGRDAPEQSLNDQHGRGRALLMDPTACLHKQCPGIGPGYGAGHWRLTLALPSQLLDSGVHSLCFPFKRKRKRLTCLDEEESLKRRALNPNPPMNNTTPKSSLFFHPLL